MFNITKVLISDDIDPICPKILRDNGIEVTLKSKLPKEELLKEIAEGYDALLVRSATKVTKEVINAGKHLKLIGRAGTGVDNIDVPVATKNGIIVMNTPTGNSRSAAELTCTMIMSLARSVPQAHYSMKQGKWDRKNYMGNEVYGKTLAIIGLGRIGREVASRMQAFGMKTIGFDPLVSAEESSKFGVQWLELEKIWSLADYITLHVPLIPATKNLVNKDTLAKCKQGVKFINCARGGVIEEHDLIKALDDGKCGGAAFDVFLEEPPTFRELIDHPKVISTPHLGASTKEAQVRVAEEIAEQIVAAKNGEALIGAINANIQAVVDESNAKWVTCAQNLAQIMRAVLNCTGENVTTVKLSYPKEYKHLESILKAGALYGFLKKQSQNGLNLINAELYAKDAGITITCSFSEDSCLHFYAADHVSTGCPSAAGTIFTDYSQKRLPMGLLCHGAFAFAIANVELPKTLSSKCYLTNGAASFLKVHCFTSLDENEIKEMPKECSLVQF